MLFCIREFEYYVCNFYNVTIRRDRPYQREVVAADGRDGLLSFLPDPATLLAYPDKEDPELGAEAESMLPEEIQIKS